MSEAMVGRPVEERIAHIEGTLEQMDKRLDDVGRRLDSVERRLDAIDGKFNWVIRFILMSWITLVGLLVAVLLKTA